METLSMKYLVFVVKFYFSIFLYETTEDQPLFNQRNFSKEFFSLAQAILQGQK